MKRLWELLLRGSAPSGGGFALNVTVRRTTGVAPFPAHFDATASTAPVDIRLCSFEWYFGEASGPGAAPWGAGLKARSRATGSGIIQGHLYEVPGAITGALCAMLYNGNVVASWSGTTITVQDPDVVYAGTKTVVYSPTSDFSHAPSGSTHVGSGSLDTVLATAASNGAGYRYMFNGAETYTMANLADDQHNNWHSDDIYIDGSLGGGRATFTTSGTAASNACSPLTMGMDSTPFFARATVKDIVVDGTPAAAKSRGIDQYAGVDLTVVRVTGNEVSKVFQNSIFGDFYNARIGTQYHGHVLFNGLAIYDSGITNPQQQVSAPDWPYGAFVYGNYLQVQGCNFDVGSNSTADGWSHAIRIPHAYKAVVGNNNLKNAGHGEHCLKIHSETQANIEGQGNVWATSIVGPSSPSAGWTDWINATGNDITPAFGAGPVAVGSPSNFPGPDAATQVRRVYLDANRVNSGPRNTFQLGIMFWAEKGSITNNIFSITTSDPSRCVCVHLGTRGGVLGGLDDISMPRANDVIVANNSAYIAPSLTAKAMMIYVQAEAIDPKQYNNVLWAPNDTSPAIASGSDSATGVAITAVGYVASNSSTPTQCKQATSPYLSSTPASLANFALAPGSYAANAGLPLLSKDISGVTRSATVPDMGAIEA